MAIQVNARLDEAEWEQIVELMPGLSNGERMTRLVRQQLTLMDSRHDLTRALKLVEVTFEPCLQALREQRLNGNGADLVETLAKTVSELGALLLARTDALAKAPDQTLPDLEALLVQVWTRATLAILRDAALDPSRLRNPHAVLPELQRIFDQTRILAQATAASASATPTATTQEKE